MAGSVTDAQLRAALQLPTRPYSEARTYDGSPYYDLAMREPVAILGVSGTAASTSRNFVSGTDYTLHDGVIDWTLPGGGVKPDFGSAFTIDYTYSRLGSASSAQALSNATLIVTMDLGSTYPYGQVSPQGVKYDDIASFLMLLCAAREACATMVSSEIDLAAKVRRGSVLIDDTKKTADWATARDDYDTKYRRYLTMARPMGKPSAFSRVLMAEATKVFPHVFEPSVALTESEGAAYTEYADL